MFCRIMKKKIVFLITSSKVKELPNFQGISRLMKNTKDQICSEPDIGMRFTAEISNVWA